jgi:hypothetical protein
MTKRLSLILLLSGTFASASILNIHISGVTNTQAILQYQAPDAQACAVEVSEKSDFSLLVNDVDPTKFAGANLDSRTGNFSSGRLRTFVIGKRAADRALNQFRISRALQALTVHYYRITCPSTNDTAKGQFETANLMMGSSYTDDAPADTTQPGEYAWPSISFNSRQTPIVDPQTGVLIRQVSLPVDQTITESNFNQAFQFARSATWLNPTAALSTTNTGASASIAGNNTGTLLITPQNNGYAGYISFFRGGRGNNLYTLNYFQLNLTASTSSASCDTNAVDDCKVVVCLSIDGANCYPGSKLMEQALTSTSKTYTLGSTNVIDLWQNTGARPPNGVELATRTGYLTCDGSSTVTLGYGDFAGTHWSAGTTIHIDTTDYTIASVNGLSSLTLTRPCTATSVLQWSATNFGVLLRKKTASANSVNIQAASSNYQMGVFPFWDFSGAFDLCGPTAVVGPSGHPGYNCVLQQAGPMYWIDGVTGEAHLFSRYFGAGPSGTAGCGYSDSIIFDSVNPDVFYCSGSSSFGALQQPSRVQYFGNHSEPTNTNYPGSFEYGEAMQLCNSATPPTNQPCLRYTSLVGTSDMATLTQAFDPTFQKDRYQHFFFVGLENGVMLFRVWRGAHNSVGWTVVFDPNAMHNQEPNDAGCLGSGQPGCVIGAFPSWSRPGARWCTLKGNNPIYQPGWLSITPLIWASPGDTNAGVGPYQSTVTDGSSLLNALNAAGGPTTCPVNALGVTGQNCTTVTVDGEPRDFSPCVTDAITCGGAVETGQPGELMNAQVGDQFSVGIALSSSEIVRLVAKSGTNGQIWTLQRGYNGVVTTTGANPSLYAFCSSKPNPLRLNVAGGEWYWNYAADPHGYNTNGSTVLGDGYSINAHLFFQNGVEGIGYTDDPRCDYGPGHLCYQTREFTTIPEFVKTPPNGIEIEDPFFAGKFGPADPNQEQQHPSGPGLNSTKDDRHYFFDGRPFNGTFVSGSTNGDGGSPATLVSGQLYKFTASQMSYFDRKFLPTFAYSGSRRLVDISGPSSQLGSNAADSNKYCVALLAGECVAGSTAGDVYVNAPNVNRPYCHFPGQATGMPDEADICIGNNSEVYNGIMQLGVSWIDNYGAHMRMLTKGLGRNRLLSPFWHTHALPNARWILIHTNYMQNVGDMVTLAKVPPPPPQDSVNRATFIPMLIKLQPPAGLAVDNAVIEFGYVENGSPGSYYCTSRGEACAVGPSTNNAAVDATNPFYFESSEATALTGTPCSKGCSINIPTISQRLVYGRVLYRGAAKQVISRGTPFVLAAP